MTVRNYDDSTVLYDDADIYYSGEEVMATHVVERLEINAGETLDITAGNTLVVLNYYDGDLDGVIVSSKTPGVPAYLNMPAAGITVSNTSFTDIDASGGGVIDATDGGVDGGGNTNILFPVAAGGNPTKLSLRLERTLWQGL